MQNPVDKNGHVIIQHDKNLYDSIDIRSFYPNGTVAGIGHYKITYDNKNRVLTLKYHNNLHPHIDIYETKDSFVYNEVGKIAHQFIFYKNPVYSNDWNLFTINDYYYNDKGLLQKIELRNANSNFQQVEAFRTYLTYTAFDEIASEKIYINESLQRFRTYHYTPYTHQLSEIKKYQSVLNFTINPTDPHSGYQLVQHISYNYDNEGTPLGIDEFLGGIGYSNGALSRKSELAYTNGNKLITETFYTIDSLGEEMPQKYDDYVFNSFHQLTKHSTFSYFQNDWHPNIEYTIYFKPAPILRNSDQLQSDLNCFPNPVSSILFINLSLEESSTIQFSILNGTGQVVRKMEKEGLAGVNQWEYSLEDLPRGLYIIAAQYGRTSISSKIFKN